MAAALVRNPARPKPVDGIRRQNRRRRRHGQPQVGFLQVHLYVNMLRPRVAQDIVENLLEHHQDMALELHVKRKLRRAAGGFKSQLVACKQFPCDCLKASDKVRDPVKLRIHDPYDITQIVRGPRIERLTFTSLGPSGLSAGSCLAIRSLSRAIPLNSLPISSCRSSAILRRRC